MTSNEAEINDKSSIDNWNEYTLGNITKIIGGGTPSTKVPSYWNGNIPWITPKDLSMQKSKYIERGGRNITKNGLTNSNANLIPPNSVILSTRAPIGYIAISRRELTTNQGCHTLITSDNIDAEFLYYLLKKNVEFLKSQSNGSTFGELSSKTLKEIKFLFPPLKEQKAIAKNLSDLDTKIELNKKMNKTLEAIAQAIFKHWFIDFEFPNEEGKPYKSSGGEMVDSELGRIPKGWKISALGDSIKFTKGKKPSEISSELRDSFAPLILINMLDGNEPIYGNAIGMNFIKKYYPIMVMDGASSGRVELGFEGILGSTIASITAKNESLSNFYIYYCLKRLQAEIIDNTTGTSIPHADKKRIETKRILIPSEEILLKFNEFSKNVTDSIFNRREQISSLRNIRDLALPKLISGKIRVPVED